MPENTPPTNSPEMEDVQNRIGHLLRYANDCERRFYAGEMVDLSGLDRETEKLCTDLLNLPPAESRQCIDRLQVLIGKIEDIGKAVGGQ